MLFSSELIPKDVELCAKANVFADFVDIVDVFTVDDDLSFFVIIGVKNTRQYIDKGCFSCTIVSQDSHQLIRLDLHSQLIDSMHLFF